MNQDRTSPSVSTQGALISREKLHHKLYSPGVSTARSRSSNQASKHLAEFDADHSRMRRHIVRQQDSLGERAHHDTSTLFIKHGVSPVVCIDIVNYRSSGDPTGNRDHEAHVGKSLSVAGKSIFVQFPECVR